jgi:hypothetical protein
MVMHDMVTGENLNMSAGLTFPAPSANFRSLRADLINSLRALNKYG